MAKFKQYQFSVQQELKRLSKQKMEVSQFQVIKSKNQQSWKVLKSLSFQQCELKQRLNDTNKFVQQFNMPQIQGKFKKIRKQLQHAQTTLKSMIMDKANSIDLQNHYSKVLLQMQNSVKQIAQKFSEKQQTKRALLYLEKRCNGLSALLQKQKPQENLPQDALFATSRPWKCASCANNLVKYQGKINRQKAGQHKIQAGTQKQPYQNFIQKLALKKISAPLEQKNDQKLQLLAQAILNLQQQDTRHMKQMNYMHLYGQSKMKLKQGEPMAAIRHQEQQVEKQKQKFQDYIQKAQNRTRSLTRLRKI